MLEQLLWHFLIIKLKTMLIKITTKDNFVCTLCGYVYEEENLPENFVCPKCKQGKENFIKRKWRTI